MNIFIIYGIIVIVVILTFLIVRVWTNSKSKSSNPISPDAMVINVKVENPNSNIELPFEFTLLDVKSITVDWGDGTPIQQYNKDFNAIHTYVKPGTYTIQVTGSADRYGSNVNNAATGADLIISVSSWGKLGLTDLNGAFNENINLVSVPNYIPEEVTDISFMFYGASKFNQNIESWDVSNITTMEQIFGEATSFNQPLNNWKLDNIDNMVGMFFSATSFNQPLDKWVFPKCEDLIELFFEATSFNQDITGWDMSNVQDISGMFTEATSFNQPIGIWNTSNVKDMESVFDKASSFDQDLSKWDVSKVELAQDIFNKCPMLGKYSQYPDFATSQIIPYQNPQTSSYYGSP